MKTVLPVIEDLLHVLMNLLVVIEVLVRRDAASRQVHTKRAPDPGIPSRLRQDSKRGNSINIDGMGQRDGIAVLVP